MSLTHKLRAFIGGELCNQAADEIERLQALVEQLRATHVDPLANESSYERMFLTAISALAEIDTLLGVPQDGCNSPSQTMAYIRALQARAALPATVGDLPDRLANALSGIVGQYRVFDEGQFAESVCVRINFKDMASASSAFLNANTALDAYARDAVLAAMKGGQS